MTLIPERALILTASGAVPYNEALAAYDGTASGGSAPIVATIANTLPTAHVLITSLSDGPAAFAAIRAKITALAGRLTNFGV